MNKIAIIGTCFTDIKGYARSSYDPVGRNIGSISFFNGGVAHNVALNCANIGNKVKFISMVDEGTQGDKMISLFHSAQIETDAILRTESGGNGLWLAVLDETGNLAGSISQPPNFALLEEHLKKLGKDYLKDCSALLLEIDLNESIADISFEMAERAGIPVYLIVGNLSVALTRTDLLKKAECFICNEIEAGKIFGCDLSGNSPEQIQKALVKYSQQFRINCMVITAGEQGSVWVDNRTHQSGIQKAAAAALIDTTGAGDAYFSACVSHLTAGYSLADSAAYGAWLASCVISDKNNYYRG